MRRIAFVFVLSGLTAGLSVQAASARTFNVQPGHSIQQAIDQANPGDRIFVRPGVYHEQGRPCPSEPGKECAVVIRKDDISLIGRPRSGAPVVIENAGDQDQGIAVGRTADASCLADSSKRVAGSLISNVEVNGFEDDGVFLFCVDNWRVTRVAANDDAEYGIFPSHVGAGRVDHSTATGANDTGLYIGQSHDVEIDHNVAHGNVSGFEIENSSFVRAHDNESYGNTGGLLSFTLPGLDVKSNHDNEISSNSIHNNDKANTCLEPGDSVCAVPPGTGLLLLAADTNSVHDNAVIDNKTFGIAVANYCTGNPCSPPPSDINTNPDGNRIVSNVATGNGFNPDPSVPSIFADDLAWDFSGLGNCWSNNTAQKVFPPNLPACP